MWKNKEEREKGIKEAVEDFGKIIETAILKKSPELLDIVIQKLKFLKNLWVVGEAIKNANDPIEMFADKYENLANQIQSRKDKN